MNEAQSELAQAEIKSREARARLTATLVDIQSRINPRALARDAIDEIRDAGQDAMRTALTAAKRNPGSIMAIAATLVALIARGWIADKVMRQPAETGGDPPRLAKQATVQDNAQREGSIDD